MPNLKKYQEIVGEEKIQELFDLASQLKGRSVLHINSTRIGGGVAEMLNRLVPLFNQLGLKTAWKVLEGEPPFFKVTKLFHNALQGGALKLTPEMQQTYFHWNERNTRLLEKYYDFKIIHDPQPLPLASFFKKKGFWLWRCHIDLTKPHQQLWNHLSPFILRYDCMLVSLENYKNNLDIKQHIIHPAIDPFSRKNRPLKNPEKVLEKYGLNLNKPIITQVSRLDPWKDPLGVIDVFQEVRKKTPCQLILVTNYATDDPESLEIRDQVLKKIKGKKDIRILNENDPLKNDKLVNAIQRCSQVILQKSIREGFGLTVTEALWKGTPVIGGNCGGIPLQVKHGKTGFLVNNNQEAVHYTLKLLKDEKLREQMGQAGKEHIRNNFLITRQLKDYLELFIDLEKNSQSSVSD